MSLFARLARPKLLQVDVFSDRALSGNAAAVVFGAGGRSDATLQAIARETNLSETVFILPPAKGGDYLTRIFTIRREIPFAGHPSLAAAHAFSHMGDFPVVPTELRQECGAGIISVSGGASSSEWFVRLPRARIAPIPVPPAEVEQLFGLTGPAAVLGEVEIAATGVPWMMVEIADVGELAGVNPDFSRIAAVTRAHQAVGVTLWTRNPVPGVDARLRAFAPAEGIYEDPVCGSCAGALAAIMRREREIPAEGLMFEQGVELGRTGMITVRQELDGGLALGGKCTTVLTGQFQLEDSGCRV
jgi:PhzF family phenazine biosynthesis protein